MSGNRAALGRLQQTETAMETRQGHANDASIQGFCTIQSERMSSWILGTLFANSSWWRRFAFTDTEEVCMDYPRVLLDYKERVDEGLRLYIASLSCPSRLKEAMSYSLMIGGKRIKSALLLAATSLCEPRGPNPLPTACAIEMIHTYSLIHDDLPAMDNDDYRRGQPSNHKKFGEALAILAGDALLTEAFVFMAGHFPSEHAVLGIKVIREVSVAAGAAGMVGGQVRDTLETGHAVSLDELRMIHAMKTGALFRAALRCGGMLAYANEASLAALDPLRRGRGLGLSSGGRHPGRDGRCRALGENHWQGRGAGEEHLCVLAGAFGEPRLRPIFTGRSTQRPARHG